MHSRKSPKQLVAAGWAQNSPRSDRRHIREVGFQQVGEALLRTALRPGNRLTFVNISQQLERFTIVEVLTFVNISQQLERFTIVEVNLPSEFTVLV